MKCRVFTEINGCHKFCCYFKECGGFRAKNKRCPEWTLKTSWKQPLYEHRSKEKLY